MKKFLATFALALGVFAFSTTTHATDYYLQQDASFLTNCDLLKSYHNDSHAVKGSYLEVNCDFGFWSNDVTLTTDGAKLSSCNRTSLVGEYKTIFANVSHPAGNCHYVYQRLYTSSSVYHANWWVKESDTVNSDSVTGRLPDFNDEDVHVTATYKYPKAETLWYTSTFGSWDTGSERIAIYLCTE